MHSDLNAEPSRCMSVTGLSVVRVRLQVLTIFYYLSAVEYEYAVADVSSKPGEELTKPQLSLDGAQ